MRDIEDMDESVYEPSDTSACCGASVYTETDICSDCKEHCDVEKESKTTWHFEEKELKEVDHCQKYTCEDCAYDDGHLKSNVSCECGRNDDE